MPEPKMTAEWLETDGLGGFASGTVSGIRSRRYHALLLPATTPPTGRIVLVNGFEAWAETDSGSYPITSQYYEPNVIQPNGMERITEFQARPWPTWTYTLEDGTKIVQEIFLPRGSSAVAVRWQLIGQSKKADLYLRPLISGRDYHSLHRENPTFCFESAVEPGHVVWQPYKDLPEIHAQHNGKFERKIDWYRNFLYTAERDRGLDCDEDLASPGQFRWDLTIAPATWVLSTRELEEDFEALRTRELKRRKNFADSLHQSADQFIVRRGEGRTIIAGYPWFTDWGRDTFIALRGLCIANGRLDDARCILLDWASTISQGMVPNRFPDSGSQPEYNSVDASLWYIVAIHDFLLVKPTITQAELEKLHGAIQSILTGYAQGTRFNIHADADGLLRAGEPGVQLTWMDAKVGDWVVTPRIGKPVEIQALWLNALYIGSLSNEAWKLPFGIGLKSFREKFWNPERNCLFDIIDVDHQSGINDRLLRPNQIFAVGGLPLNLLEPEQAKLVVDCVEKYLVTPMGLRTLAEQEPGYQGHYGGDIHHRDGAYHQGTTWPWLIGPFIEAWQRVRGDTAEAKAEAKARFLEPLLEKMDTFGIGHVAEIADGDSPFVPNGCPFQAWSLGEVMRVLDRG